MHINDITPDVLMDSLTKADSEKDLTGGGDGGGEACPSLDASELPALQVHYECCITLIVHCNSYIVHNS